MSDLNILGMIAGEQPGYASEKSLYAQKLAVLIMVSDKDIGRTYGGELAALQGEASIDVDGFRAEMSAMLQEAVDWMKQNDPTVPEDFDATLESVDVTPDGFTVTIETTTDGVSFTPSTIRLW